MTNLHRCLVATAALLLPLLMACGPAPSCTLSDNGDGTRTMTCPDGTSMQLVSTDGSVGCNVRENADGSKTITCTDGSEVTVRDGRDGEDGKDGLQGAPGPVGPVGRPGEDGRDGTDGTNGADGGPGADGADGTNGTDGRNALLLLVPEPPGAHCAHGGMAVHAGPDLDGNGVLDPVAEVTSTAYLCNGAPGQPGNDGDAGSDGSDALQALVELRREEPGANCSTGGTRVISGLDLNGNGQLDDDEVTQAQYVCNAPNHVLALDFAGLEAVGLQRRTLVGLDARIFGAFDPTRALRWEVKIQEVQGAGVQGVQFFHPMIGEEELAHGTWTGVTTSDPFGNAVFGGAAGFTAADVGLQAPGGGVWRWSVRMPAAGSYRIDARLVALDDGSVVGTGSTSFTVEDLTSRIALNGFSTVPARARNLVELKGRLAHDTPPDTQVAWRLRLKTQAGQPVAAAPFFLPPAGGADPSQHFGWTDVVSTDAAGEVILGDPAGVPAETGGFLEAGGVSQLLSFTLPAGEYEVTAELVDLEGGSVLTSSSRTFLVEERPTSFGFQGFSGLNPSARNLVAITTFLETAYDPQTLLVWRFTVLRDGAPLSGFQGFYDASAPAPAEHATWTESWTTDAQGQATVGGAGFTPAELGLQVLDGHTQFLSLQPAEGAHLLRVELVRVSDGAVAAAGEVSFLVEP